MTTNSLLSRRSRLDSRLSFLAAVGAGALLPFSFSPFQFWFAAFPSIALLLLLLHEQNARQAAWLGWGFGIGVFGVGASWVYVSIHVYGNASPLLAGFLTAAFVMGLALFFALQCWLFQRFFRHVPLLLSFPALWVLAEWFRGWFLTGFPWLYLGYGHLDSPLSSWAPLIGVFGLGYIVCFSACLLFKIYQTAVESPRNSFAVHQYALMVALAFWLLPVLLSRIDWVQDTQELDVALVQGNIDQALKFVPGRLENNINTYRQLSAPLWDKDLIFWPETAIPLLYQRAGPLLDELSSRANQQQSTLITGIFYRNGEAVHNSIVSLGNGSGVYHKQRLVPFGEYVPLRDVFANLLQLFALPMASISPGPANQAPLLAAGYYLTPFICYEIVYPELVRENARKADLLVTISNDTWFGASIGPLQHLEIAAMRALENGRYLVRATNNGVSAIIDHHGKILQRSEQFQAQVLSGTVKLMSGQTLFNRFGSLPLFTLCVLLLGFSLLCYKKSYQPPAR